MNEKKIREAVKDAREFIARADVLLKDADAMRYLSVGCGGYALSGAIRRQSMELTRALAELRKAG
jgi:hypothetical protein